MLKKKISGTWQNISGLKKRIDGVWSDCSCAQKKYNGAWSVVWQRLLLSFTSYGNTSAYSSINLSTTANGNIGMYTYNKITVGNNLSVSIITPQLNYTLAAGETLYVDYTFNTDGGTACFADFYCGYRPTTYDVNHFASVNAGGGTVSRTVTDAIETWQLVFRITNNNYSTNDYYCELLISKIYTDSKVFYWNTETVYSK